MKQVERIGVVGAGQMGAGIAQVAAQSGFQVCVSDLSLDFAQKATGKIKAQLDKLVEKQKISSEEASQAIARIQVVEISGLKSCDLVVEAISENRTAKFDLFRKLDEICAPHCILASNTSSISITEIAAQTKRASQVAGMHFMNPVPVMKLVELIRGIQTQDQTFAEIKRVAEKMGKTCVESKDFPGFIVNRILMPMINEAVYALYENVGSVQDIDSAMKLGTNQPMGPLTLADFIGLDTCLAIMNVLHEGLGDAKYRACPLLKNYVAAGWLGKKTKKGFYTYE